VNSVEKGGRFVGREPQFTKYASEDGTGATSASDAMNHDSIAGAPSADDR
jgi:hypothetical protein